MWSRQLRFEDISNFEYELPKANDDLFGVRPVEKQDDHALLSDSCTSLGLFNIYTKEHEKSVTYH